jgi:hypothetical protein
MSFIYHEGGKRSPCRTTPTSKNMWQILLHKAVSTTLLSLYSMLNLAVIDTDYIYRSKHHEIVTMVVPRGGGKIQNGCTAVLDEFRLSMHKNFVSFGIILFLHYRPFTPQFFAEPDALFFLLCFFFVSFLIFWFWTYLMKVIPEICRVH